LPLPGHPYFRRLIGSGFDADVAEISAGILLYRESPGGPRVLLAHPGGPFFVNKDAGAWTIPKGLIAPGEDPSAAARREFAEELGWEPAGELLSIGTVKLRSGKLVHGFAIRSDETEEACLARFAPGVFSMEWPPRSGRTAEFPEVDRIQFFDVPEARIRINPAQQSFLDRLSRL
jgi:predicted NUDIX family NTP pyrophosphohydrolase